MFIKADSDYFKVLEAAVAIAPIVIDTTEDERPSQVNKGIDFIADLISSWMVANIPNLDDEEVEELTVALIAGCYIGNEYLM